MHGLGPNSYTQGLIGIWFDPSLAQIRNSRGDVFMLSIFFGNYQGSNYIDNPDLYFDNTYEDEWLSDERSKEMVKDIDRSDLVGPQLVISPFLGSIPVTRLSGGVKTLIQVDHDPDHVYNASACGDNCAKWLLRIGQEKDILVRLGHMMHFESLDPVKGRYEKAHEKSILDPLNIRIDNTGEIVHSQAELNRKVILSGLLDEGGEA